MTSKFPTITVPQMCLTLFVSRIIINLAYNTIMSSSDDMWDHLFSSIISFVCVFILAIPLYRLYLSDPQKNILDTSFDLVGKFSIICGFIYILYYLFICCHTISIFNVFVSNVINPKISIIVLSTSVLLTSCYGAFKGLEGLVRTSILIFTIIVLSVTFLVIALISRIDTINYIILNPSNMQKKMDGVQLMLSKTSEISVLAMLFPAIKGNLKRGFISLNIGVYISSIAIILILIGSISDYVKTHIFPIYAATSVAEIGMLKRLDFFYLGIFVMGIFVKMALFLYLISITAARTFNLKNGKAFTAICAALIVVFGVFVSDFRPLRFFFGNISIGFVFTLVVSFFIPIILLVIKKIKCSKKRLASQ